MKAKAVAAIAIIAIFAVSIFLISETGITGDAISLKSVKSSVKAAKAPSASSVLLPYNSEEDSEGIEAEQWLPNPAMPSRVPRDSIGARIRGVFLGRTIEPTYNIALSAADRVKFPTLSMEKYQRFQRENPGIFRLMIWKNAENPSGKSIIYSQQKMESLSHYIALLETGQPFPFTAPSQGVRSESLSEGRFVQIYYNETDVWNVFAPHLAASLFVEVNHLVPWTVRSYNENSLKALFDGTKFISYYSTDNAYKFSMDRTTGSGSQGITDWNAFYNLNFLRTNSMIKPTQEESIYELTEWMSQHLFHDWFPRAYSVRRDYNYNSSNYPVDKILNPPARVNSYTAGCPGTASLYGALLSTINIPVMKNSSLPEYFPESGRLGWHIGVVFPTANLALVHGDEPYTMSYLRGPREVPESEAMYTIDEFTAFNNPVLEEGSGATIEQQIANQATYEYVKRQYEIGYKYSAYGLLAHRAHELTYYPSPSSSNRMETRLRTGFYKPIFDDLHIQQFISDLDANITVIGSGNFDAGKRILVNWLVSRNREV